MAMRIKSLREAANLTQVQLADSLGVLSTTVSNWETGVALPKTAILPQLAETLRYAPFLSPRMPGRSGWFWLSVLHVFGHGECALVDPVIAVIAGDDVVVTAVPCAVGGRPPFLTGLHLEDKPADFCAVLPEPSDGDVVLVERLEHCLVLL